MEIGGLPLHPLVVHAAVVLTPVAALLTAVYALRGSWRWWSRWPAVLTTVAAFGSLLVAKVTGGRLLAERPFLLSSPLLAERIHLHQTRGNQLLLLMAAFTVLTLVGAWVLGGPSPLVSGWGARESRASVLATVLSAGLVAGAVLVLVWVVLTGDAGARAVWGR